MEYNKSTIYQIYPKSFCDSNGDGIGDLEGIRQKLEYIKELGADMIWITPFFRSPQRDNGYDISDYLSIEPMYGDMEDVDRLIEKADSLGIGVMLDMVFNHTSTEHEWFQRALAGEEEFQNYYIFRDGKPDNPPTNWESKFGGSAWEYVPELGKWYLHLFDKTQADLNWENPKVREELKNVIRFWKKKGVKGFRFDVINLISKPEVFEDDDRGDGRRFYTDGPKIHEYLKELHRDCELGDVVTVGEMSSTSLESCIKYTDPAQKELNMSFSFHHLKVDYKNGDKWSLMPPDLKKLKEILCSWQIGMAENSGWNALFWSNHDQPRTVSRFGGEGEYFNISAKMLAVLMYLMRGTPYVYQGEELGLANCGFRSLDKYRDVESLNYYEILRNRGLSEKEAMEAISQRSRDNGRTPMQWTEGENYGFTTGKPWIPLSELSEGIYAKNQISDENSVFSFFKNVISLRKELRVIAEGDIDFFYCERSDIFCYNRTLSDEQITVICNMTGEATEADFAKYLLNKKLLLSNYEDCSVQTTGILRPYEAAVYLK